MSTVKVETEHVMVVPTQLFHTCGYFQGFNAETDQFLPVLLDPNETKYLPRNEMEEDPSYKQLIPYCIFRYVDEQSIPHVFQYVRGKSQGESRLHTKSSIGIGGHISTLDLTDESPYEVGMNRELNEEVVIQTKYTQECVGLINDDENEVGKVHLGIVHIFDVEEPNVRSNETGIIESGFVPVSDLIKEIDRFETWSQICLRALF
ncbi:MAG: phosphoesterase [Planctomycetota bacterium]